MCVLGLRYRWTFDATSHSMGFGHCGPQKQGVGVWKVTLYIIHMRSLLGKPKGGQSGSPEGRPEVRNIALMVLASRSAKAACKCMHSCMPLVDGDLSCHCGAIMFRSITNTTMHPSKRTKPIRARLSKLHTPMPSQTQRVEPPCSHPRLHNPGSYSNRKT